MTQRILVGSHIRDREVNERVDLHNLHTDHVMIRSELKYLIGGKVVMLKCQVFRGKTGPFPVGWGCRVIRPIAMFRNRPRNVHALLTLFIRTMINYCILHWFLINTGSSNQSRNCI